MRAKHVEGKEGVDDVVVVEVHKNLVFCQPERCCSDPHTGQVEDTDGLIGLGLTFGGRNTCQLIEEVLSGVLEVA